MKIDGSMFYFVSNGAPELESYQACILESTANLHPGTRIFVIFITAEVGDILHDKLTCFYIMAFTALNKITF